MSVLERQRDSGEYRLGLFEADFAAETIHLADGSAAVVQAYRDSVPRKFRKGSRRTTAAAQLKVATEILVDKGVLQTPSPESQRSITAEDFLDHPEKIVTACGGVRSLESWPI